MWMRETIADDIKENGFDFRLNDLDDSLEISYKGKWQRLTDPLKAIVTITMREAGYGSKKAEGEAKPGLAALWEGIMAHAYANRHNPVKAYFAKAASDYKPQGKDNLGNPIPYTIPEFSKWVYSQDDMFSTWLFRWMVGVAHKAFTGSRNPMLVLGGNQEIGKSTLAEYLSPLPRLFVRGSISPDNKDHRIRLANNIIWEVDELGSTTRRKDADALKSFITLSEVFERLPYGVFPVLKPAICSFIGTFNPDGAGVLNDPTGTTRFLVTKLNHIGDYRGKTNFDELWQEAAYFQREFPHSRHLTKEEAKIRRAINAEHEIQSALGEVIDNICEITHDEDDFITTQQIADKVSGYYRINSSQAFYNELGRVMAQRGVNKGQEQINGRYKRGWRGIKIDV